MACCLMAPSFYLNLCWLLMSEVLGHTSQIILQWLLKLQFCTILYSHRKHPQQMVEGQIWPRHQTFSQVLLSFKDILSLDPAHTNDPLPCQADTHGDSNPSCLPYVYRIISNNVNSEEELNTSRPRQNGRHFSDDIFKCIFLNENVWILILISMKFIPEGPINNIPELAQIMAWRRPGNKLLSEPMMVNLLMHICITRPQGIKQKPTWKIKSSICSLLLLLSKTIFRSK